jgi:serine phosphatase RsbU (regulator of sigma subunit)
MREQIVSELPLQAEMAQARQLLACLEPKPLPHAALHFEHHLQAAATLSGDALDYFALNDTQTAFYLADVAGSGVDAALVVVWLKTLLQGLKHQVGGADAKLLAQPLAVLTLLDQELKATGFDKHITLFYAVADSKNAELHYAVGGHFPMPILLSQGQARYLEGQAMPIGLFTPVRFRAYNCRLPQDFRLFLCSDGLLELMPSTPEQDKEAKLLEMVSQAAGHISQLESVLHLADSKAWLDDIAMLSVGWSKV